MVMTHSCTFSFPLLIELTVNKLVNCISDNCQMLFCPNVLQPSWKHREQVRNIGASLNADPPFDKSPFETNLKSCLSNCPGEGVVRACAQRS